MKDNLHLDWSLKGSSIDEKSINFCLKQLKLDNSRHSQDNFAGIATYEEVIGALLYAKEILRENDNMKSYIAVLEKHEV